MCLISNQCDYFPLRYSYISIFATCTTSGRWQRYGEHLVNLVAKGRKIKIAIYNKCSPKMDEDDEYQKKITKIHL